MYKLYNVKCWGSMGPHFLLEEMGVPYQNVWMTAEQVRTPEFRAISPLGLIPALGLDDGRAVFESAAIVSFLTTAHADKKMAPMPGTADHGIFLSWLAFMSANLYATVNLSFAGNPYARTPDDDAFIVAKATEKAMSLFGIIDAKLAKEGPWMMGEEYSALDLYLLVLCIFARPNEAAVYERHAAIARLAAAVRERPILKAALEAHGVQKAGGYGG